MYISCSGIGCDGKNYPTIQETIAKLKDVGFRSFDLDAFENWQHVSPSVLAEGDDQWVEAFISTVSETSMNVSSFNCGLSKALCDPEPEAFTQCKKEFMALLDLARAVGCPNLTLQPGERIEGIEDKQMISALKTHLAELAEPAQESGISLGVENHYGSVVENPDVILEVVAPLWPAVGLTYDPSHFVMQDISLPEYEPLLARTTHVHVRNASTGKMQDTMENGTVDFEWLIPALERNGYDGAVTIEYFSAFDKDFTTSLVLRDLLIELGVNELSG
jgi:sugar phosphate isomerase/epimerase